MAAEKAYVIAYGEYRFINVDSGSLKGGYTRISDDSPWFYRDPKGAVKMLDGSLPQHIALEEVLRGHRPGEFVARHYDLKRQI